MSVINKMLRDLDQRQAASNRQVAGKPLAPDQLMRGTQALGLPSGQARGQTWRWAAVATLTMVLLGGLVWWVTSSRPAPAAVAAKDAQAPAAAAAPVLSPMPSALIPAPASTPAAMASLAASAASPVPTAVAANKLVGPLPGIHTATPAPSQPVATESARSASQTRASTPVKALPSPARSEPIPNTVSALALGAGTAPAVAPVKPVPDALPQGANQALAQAQAMWNEGSRASAIDLLQQAVGRAETSATPATLATLVRELVRMELAEAQVNQALKLLQRLEPQIAQVPELWSMRGNAAQRLGQHTEAASSYQHALNLKPGEPRWMLGLAVSLAAQGQTAQAGDLAEKVRLQGALRPEIANYLRQLGVVIHAD